MSNYIREPFSGKVLAYLDNAYVRNQYGEVLVSIDGNYVREGVSGGSVLANISNEFICEGVSGGQVMYEVDSYLSNIEKCALAMAVLK